MLVEGYLSHILGHLSEKSFKRIQLFLEKVFFFSFELQGKCQKTPFFMIRKEGKGRSFALCSLEDRFLKARNILIPLMIPFLDRALDWMPSLSKTQIEPRHIKINFLGTLCLSLQLPEKSECRLTKIKDLKDSAEAIELRLDVLEEIDFNELAKLRSTISLPLIFTLRKVSQGGCYKKSEKTRKEEIKKLASFVSYLCRFGG